MGWIWIRAKRGLVVAGRLEFTVNFSRHMQFADKGAQMNYSKSQVLINAALIGRVGFQFPITRVVSMGRRKTQLEITLH